MLTDTEWAIAQQVCTEKQLAALAWHKRGAGKRRVALLLDIDPSSAQDRIRSGKRRIARYMHDHYTLTTSDTGTTLTLRSGVDQLPPAA